MSESTQSPPVRRLLPLVTILLSACAATPGKGNVDTTEISGSLQRLREHRPSDIAIAPVRNQTKAQDVNVERFRQAVAEELIERLYSPLASSYVDENWVEASFRGTPPPDALLVMSITEWDPTHLYSSGRVEIGATLHVFAGGDTTRAPLWGLTLRRSIDMGDGRGNAPGPAPHLIPEAIERFTAVAMEHLPERDPLASHP